ncbi:MAG: multiheme c-type cytochrome [Candidatus Hydrogenedentota bacterium]
MPKEPKVIRIFAACLFFALCSTASAQSTQDPAAWGDDHVGKRLPDYVTGDECLFCHREKVGNLWANNAHNLSMRNVHSLSGSLKALLQSTAVSPVSKEATYIIGRKNQIRFLKPNGKYGQFAIHDSRLSARRSGEFESNINADDTWNNELFSKQCIGCHTTAVEQEYEAFQSPSLDCMVCHGDVPQGHQNEPALAHFAKSAKTDSLVETSACAQCHLREGTSQSTGLPYPNSFVAGDNLFKDFEVNFSDESIAAMNPADRHVYQNVKDVVLSGLTDITCTTCHDIHDQSSRKHRVLKRIERDTTCLICHSDKSDYEKVIAYEVHSKVCNY